jgi:hypothetical protein
MTPEHDATAARHLLKRQTYLWAASTLVAAALALAARLTAGDEAGMVAGLAAVLYGLYVVFWQRVHPRIYLGQGLALASLLAAAAVGYASFSEISHTWVWRRTFQLSDHFIVYQQPSEKWTIFYPKLWTHEEQGVSGSVLHVFKPSRVTPTMYLTATARPNVGTTDLELVVEGFFQHMPSERRIQVVTRESFAYQPGGYSAVRLIYTEQTRREPIKNETLFIMDSGRLFVLTASASPRWFDRNQEYLEGLLHSFRVKNS